ncbi:MAG TPA: hypothetical protein VNL94_08740 [Candidatus Binatia bacterium]|nr:hypothetical protein [Candidatus Binatia bacterium]
MPSRELDEEAATMIRSQTETTIKRPREAVFAAVVDPKRYEEWSDMTDVRFDGSTSGC